jgi:hypothetical protein
MEFIEFKPLILTDMDQLMLVKKLTEKISTERELIQPKHSRQEIPNFYKNLNLVYSWHFLENIFQVSFNKKNLAFNCFDKKFVEFHLEIVEADEVYFKKTEMSQKSW